MTAYLVNILIISVAGAYLLGNRPSLQRKKIFVVIASALWVILSGLRHSSVGADTLAYQYSFESTATDSWASLLESFVNILFRGVQGKDPGYSLLEKAVYVIIPSYQVYLLLIALLFMIPLGILVFRYSGDPYISFLLYATLFYSFFAITGQRQTIATAIVVLIGYKFIRKRKLIPFIVLILLSATIHKSALVFLPFYFLANKKITWNYLIFALATFPVLFYYRVPVALFLQDLGGYDYGIYEGAGTLNFSIILILVFVVALLQYKPVLRRNPQAVQYYNALIIALWSTILTWVNPSAMRVVQYYSIFLILLVPELIRSFQPKDRRVVYIVIVSLSLLLFMRNNPHYRFFWG